MKSYTIYVDANEFIEYYENEIEYCGDEDAAENISELIRRARAIHGKHEISTLEEYFDLIDEAQDISNNDQRISCTGDMITL